jgi:hypothetical protein
MKKETFTLRIGTMLLVWSIVLAFGAGLLKGQSYCVPSSDCSEDMIDIVFTTGGVTNFSNLGSGCSIGGYGNFSATHSVTAPVGGSFNITVQSSSLYTYAQGFRIWVDWNNDGDFDDPGEDVWNSVTAAITPFTGTITVPVTALPGSKRMRVRCNYNGVPTDPCLLQSYGEAEDYTLVVTGTTPTCLPPTAIVASNVLATSLDLNWTENNMATTWQVQGGLAGFPLGTGLSSIVTTKPVTIPGLTASTAYHFYVRSICSAGDTSLWAGPYSVTTAFACPPNAVCATYTAGDIPTDYQSPWVGPSTCPGQLTVVIPPGNWITSLNVEYTMTAANGAYMSEAFSRLFSPTLNAGEAAYAVGVGSTAGTYSYSRTGLTFANQATGSVVFNMDAGRNWGSTAPNDGCGTWYNKVDNGTWMIIAYYATSPVNDAGIVSIDEPVTPSVPGLQDVKATITTVGSSNLTSCTINWSVNGVVQTPFAWTGNLAQAQQSTSVTIGSFNFPAGTHDIKVWTSNPNNQPDIFPANDTTSISVIFSASMTGVYTIGGAGADFATITDAVTQYNNSMLAGPVTFLLNTSTLGAGETFPIVIEKNNHASATNTLTIKPAPGLNVTVSGSSASSIFRINEAEYVTIDGSNSGTNSRNLTIENTSTAGNTAAIWISSPGAIGASYITVKNCVIMAGINSVTSTMGVYVAGGSITTSGTGASNNNITIHNNQIMRCYFGVFARGVATTGMLNSLVISNNVIGSNNPVDYVLFNGVTVQNATAPLIIENEIFNLKVATSVNVAGIDLGINVNDAMVAKNKIYGIHSISTSGYGAYGVNISATATSNITIQNNFISDIITANYSLTSTTWNAFGIRITGGTNHKVYYNSINLYGNVTSGSSVGMSAALMVTVTVATGLDVRNNVFANSTVFGVANSKSYAVYVPTGFVFGNINHNNYYVDGVHGVFGFYGADVSSLMDWTLLSLGDANSISANPIFTSGNDLHAYSLAMYLTGTPIPGIVDDIDGDLRHATTPCIGADEFILFTNDAGIFAMTAPIASCPGIQDVKVLIQNYGLQPFTGVTVNWAINGVAQIPYVFTGTIASGTSQEVTLGSYNFLGTTTYNLVFSTSGPGGMVDMNPSNDSLVVTGYRTSMTGTFTVGAAPTDDFPTIIAVVNAMNTLGVCGPVVINVSPTGGPYAGGFELTPFPGASAATPITFNGNGSVIQAGVPTFVIAINGLSYVTINDFQIINPIPSNNKFGIMVRGAAQHINITNNYIDMGTTSTSTLTAGIAVSNSTTSALTAGNNAQYVTITNNEIVGGYYGITLMGAASYLNCFGNLVADNIVRDFYLYGIYLGNNDSTVVTRNNINRATRSVLSTFYGIYATTSRNVKYTDNKIHSSGTGSYTAYPIWIATTANTLGYESEIVNNLIYNIPTATTFYGIYISGSMNYLNIYHNTVHMTPTGGTGATRGIWLAVAPNNTRVFNNIISIVTPATGIKFGIYVTTTSTTFTANNNVYHLDAPGTNNHVGYWTANRTTLGDWQMNSMQDGNSSVANPVFGSPLTGNMTPLSQAIDNMGTPVGVMTDINNAPRSAMTPDIGAIEFTGLPSDLALTGANLVNGECLSANDSVYVTISNIVGGVVDFAVNPLTIHWSVTGPQNSNGNIIVNSGTLATSTSLILGAAGVDLSKPGIYTLSTWISANAVNLFAGNDTLNNFATKEIFDPFYVVPKTVLVTNSTQTVGLSARSGFFPAGAFFITEICHFKTTNGAPPAGWPTYLLADDYIEITGVPNSDLAGITLEQWTTTMVSSFTFLPGTVLGPNGTAVIAVGEMGSSVPSPANFYYHGQGAYTGTFGSTTTAGRILKDGNGTIIDAVVYGSYTFPAAANVTAADWTGTTLSVSSSGNGCTVLIPRVLRTG